MPSILSQYSSVSLNLLKLLNRYGETRFVGGSVRDIMLGRKILDVDFATIILPHQIIEICKTNGMQFLSVGIEYGTITIISDNQSFEITTLRKDLKCDGRHTEISFTDNWLEDAKRRDFTINAMSVGLDDKLYDYFNGINDLKNRAIKFIGDPYVRIHEDYLRILRYFRFYGFFGSKNVDLESLKAAQTLSYNLRNISKERVKSEIFKLLSYQHCKEALEVMPHSLFDSIGLPISNGISSTLDLSDEPILNLAILLYKSKISTDEMKKFFETWPLSTQEIKSLNDLLLPKRILDINVPISEQLKYLYYMGTELYKSSIKFLGLVNGIDIKNLMLFAEQQYIPVFPINGYDVMKLGLKNKEIGIRLEKLKQAWINSGFTLTKKELLKLL